MVLFYVSIGVGFFSVSFPFFLVVINDHDGCFLEFSCWGILSLTSWKFVQWLGKKQKKALLEALEKVKAGNNSSQRLLFELYVKYSFHLSYCSIFYSFFLLQSWWFWVSFHCFWLSGRATLSKYVFLKRWQTKCCHVHINIRMLKRHQMMMERNIVGNFCLMNVDI